jgi:DNA-binding IclR family transcriptional regulator
MDDGRNIEMRNIRCIFSHLRSVPSQQAKEELSMGATEPAVAAISPSGPMYSYEHEGDRQFATTLARGLEVLRCFTPLEPMLGNKEISVRTGLPKPTVSRLTYTLTKLGYLRHNMRLGKYQLGSAVLSIGYPLLASMSIRQIAQPFMKELADYCNGSVNMGIRDRLNMVYVEACRSGNISTLPDIGTAIPIAQSVIGRAFLYACTPAEREAVLNQMKVKEPEMLHKYQGSITKSLDEIRTRGFCIANGEIRREVNAVGVPMRRTVDGEIITFNCGMPSFVLKKGQLEDDIGPRLVAMVRNIEAAVGIH